MGRQDGGVKVKPVSDSITAQQRERFMDSLERYTSTVLQGINVDKALIDVAVSDLIATLSEDWAGQHIYIPTDYSHRSMAHAMAVFNACNGRNYAQVAKDHGISERTVYRIYNRMRKQLIAKNQHDMFNS